jgi:DNA polymerase III epsilon subunit-like protein
MSTPIVFIDTETTGIHPGRKVWEVAMIRRDDSGDTETEFFVEVDLSDADPFGLSVGQFYERHPEGRRLSGREDPPRPPLLIPYHAAHEVARITHGAHLVGAVPNFDAETLAPLLRDHGLIPSWHYHLIDVEALTIGYFHGRKHSETDDAEWSNAVLDVGLPWKSEEMSRAVGVDPERFDSHTALGDARWAKAIYDAVTGGGDRG